MLKLEFSREDESFFFIEFYFVTVFAFLFFHIVFLSFLCLVIWHR